MGTTERARGQWSGVEQMEELFQEEETGTEMGARKFHYKHVTHYK